MSDTEKRARAMGWVPKEDFRGDEDRWVDSDTFLDRGENIMPILKERLTKFEQNNTALTDKLDKATKQLETFVTHHKQTYKRAYDNAFRDLDAKQREAVSAADTDAYDQLQQEKEDLQKEVEDMREQQAPAAAPESPAYGRWLDENSWYKTDTDRQLFVDALGANLQANQTYKTDEEFYAELTRRTKEAFPGRFENVQQVKPAAVEGGGGGVDADLTGAGKKWADVPPEAKEIYLENFSDIPNFGKEEYAKDYWEQFKETE
jgi:hypothetical protein